MEETTIAKLIEGKKAEIIFDEQRIVDLKIRLAEIPIELACLQSKVARRREEIVALALDGVRPDPMGQFLGRA